MKYSRTRGNEREVTIETAHTVTVNSLIESNKQTNKQTIAGSATKVHLRQVMTGIRNRLHILVEKPLAMHTQQSQEIANFAHQPQNAHLKVVTTFSR